MIPKIIHYCWFGGNPLPELASRCIQSWKKYLPDYEIIEWNESNYDYESCEYIKEAYAAKKWAFVSDYARFDILYRYGGLYFDTDVEVISSLDDLIERGPFMGCEPVFWNQVYTEKMYVAPGLGLAALSQNKLYEKIIEHYHKSHFICADGSYNKTTVVTRTSDLLAGDGFDANKCNIQYIDGTYIYPPDYFCPMSYKTGKITITDNTRSIHHYMASWKTDEEVAMKQIEKNIEIKLGMVAGTYISKILIMPLRIKMKIKQFGFWGTIRMFLKHMRQRR